MAKYGNRNYTPLFTNGGVLKFNSNNHLNKSLNYTGGKIGSIYEHCTGNNDYDDIYSLSLYTTGIETDESEIDYDKLQAVSFYKIENGFLKHYFYKKDGASYVAVNDLSLNVNGVSIQKTDFNIIYADIPTEQLSVYFVKNNELADDTFTPSMQLSDFVSFYFGSQVKLNSNHSTSKIRQLETISEIGAGMCGTCRSSVSGDCFEFTGACDPSICPKSSISTTLDDNNSSYFENINLPKTYMIRDNLLRNSLFGLKYEAYYYHSSFSKLNFSLADAVEFAKILPKIYEGYDNIMNNAGEEILIDEELAGKITTILNNLKNNNQEKVEFTNILNDIIDDVNYLKNRDINYLNERIY